MRAWEHGSMGRGAMGAWGGEHGSMGRGAWEHGSVGRGAWEHGSMGWGAWEYGEGHCRLVRCRAGAHRHRCRPPIGERARLHGSLRAPSHRRWRWQGRRISLPVGWQGAGVATRWTDSAEGHEKYMHM